MRLKNHYPKRMENKSMLERDFFKRLKAFGINDLILSPDTILSVLIFLFLGFYTNWTISPQDGTKFVEIIIPVSASFFAIVLAGLAIISSFTDKNFIYAWTKAGLFADLVTLFQWNLYVPIMVTVLALIIEFIPFNSILFIFLVALFTYMIVSLMDLIKFISTYALQRADFIEIEFQKKKND